MSIDTETEAAFARSLRASSASPTHPVDPSEITAIGARRRRRRRGALSVAAIAVVAAGVGTLPDLLAPPAPTVAEWATDVPRAPWLAAQDDEVWPIELLYGSDDGRFLERFSGTSWDDWTLETIVLETGEATVQASSDDTDPASLINPEWRLGVQLVDPVVVPIDGVPGARDVVDDLGLDPGDVEVLISPSAAARCGGQELHECVTEDDEARITRALVHVPTGLPLLTEIAEGASSFHFSVHAREFSWG